MHTERRAAPEGARLLREHLDRTEQSVAAFCRAHGLDRIQVLRVLKGQYGKRVSVDFARAIERATNNEIAWHAWLQEPDSSARTAEVAA